MFRTVVALTSAMLLSAAYAGAQTPSSAIEEVIIRGSARPKPAPEIAPPPIGLFVAAPRIEQIGLSPDGSRFAFVTRKAGVRLLTTYVVADGSSQSLRLSEDALSSVTWLDNDHIMLSDTRTGIRGICPQGLSQTFQDRRRVSEMLSSMIMGGFGGSAGGSDDIMNSEQRMAFQAIQNALSTPPCTSYGVRSSDAITVVDLRTRNFTTLGKRMSDYDNRPLGLPTPVTVDGKLQLIGPFLELRDRSIAGQLAQRAYLWRVDPDTGIGRMINDGGGDLDRLGSYIDDWLIDAEGKPVVRASYSYLDTLFTIQVQKGGKWTPILKRKIDRKAHTFAPFLAGRGRDGQTLLILDAVDQPDGLRRFHYYELSSDGTLSPQLDSRDAMRDRPIFHPDTGALAGFEHEGELTTYTFFDADLAEYYRLALDMAPGKTVRVAALGKNLDQMILFTEGGDDAGSWHYYDFANSRRVDIGGQYPAIPSEWIASQREVRYKAGDGTMIRGIVTLPPQGEGKNRALVVLPHDGPLGHDRRTYHWLAQVLASRGYVVLQPNFRGSDGYDVAYTEAGYGEWSGRMLTDISDGIGYLARQGMIDPNRVCIAGQGYGGYAALASAGAQSSYRCAAAINGIADPKGYADRLKKVYDADAIAPLRADPQRHRGFVADTASLSLTRRYFGAEVPATIEPAAITVPVLVVQSQFDGTIPASQSRAVRDGLQSLGKAKTYVELPDCGHDLDTEACRLGAARALVDFLAVHNPAR